MLLSEHDVPFATGGPAVQAPVWQVSPVVHAFPSEQAVPFAAVVLVHCPLRGLQTSVVQSLPSSQSAAPPHVVRKGVTDCAVNASVASHTAGG